MNIWFFAWFFLGAFVADAPIALTIPFDEPGAINLGELVQRLSEASKLDVPRPVGSVSLPVKGSAGSLGRTMLAETLGKDASLEVTEQGLLIKVDPAQLAGDRRKDWESRLRNLSTRAEREAKRRLNYGMHARKSYRPNDPSRPTICLVHGVNSSSYGFVHMIPWLEEAGFGLVFYDYPFNRDLDASCERFASDWSAFRKQMGEKRPWSIVGHSMGVLLARDYVEGPSYAGDVDDFVMIAPVNQGSHLARTQKLLQLINSLQAVGGRKSTDALAHLGDGLGEAADDMAPGSSFLKALNARPRRLGVRYHTIAGDVAFLSQATRAQIDQQADLARRQGGMLGALIRVAAGDLPARLDEVTDGRGDGCVSLVGARLEGVNDLVVLHANHAELIRAPLLFRDPGPVPCMPALLKALPRPAAALR